MIIITAKNCFPFSIRKVVDKPINRTKNGTQN